MIICETTDEKREIPPTHFIFPLLPTRKERAQAIGLSLSSDCEFDVSFLERQNDVFDVGGTTLNEFLKKMPEFQETDELDTVFEMVRKSVPAIQVNADSTGEAFNHHIYFATTPASKDDKNIFLLEFDDNCYRPEMYVAPLDRKRSATYWDFVQTGRHWRQLAPDIVSEIFHDVGDDVVNTLNAGLNGLMRVDAKTFGVDKLSAYRITEHLEELAIVPTIWEFSDGSTQTCYDLCADWRHDANGICANLDGIRVRHEANKQGLGVVEQFA